MFVRRTWWSWRPFLATIALLVPFCACHFVLLLGTGDGCCRDGRPAFAVVPVTIPIDLATSKGEGGCRSHCCGHEAPIEAPNEDPSDSDAPRFPVPGCGSDTCCVKSAPQESPWQMPRALLVTIVDLEAIVPHGLARPFAFEWPPTLPLGQPPTLFDRGTLLLV